MAFKLRFSSLVLFFTLIISSISWANNRWFHLPLASQDGVTINIDFQYLGRIYEPYLHQTYEVADPLWLNVHGNTSGLNQKDRLDAQVIHYRRATHLGALAPWEIDSTVYIKLYWNGTNFTGQWIGSDGYGSPTTRIPVQSEGALGYFEYRQEVIFTVYKDNYLYRLIDPISQTPYFKFNLREILQ